MIAKRPSIFIYTNDADAEILREICAGIEEEGVFFEVFQRDMKDTDVLAWEAANDSMMGSGIGICGKHVVLQMRGLKAGENVSVLEGTSKDACRALGANSARIIKKMPLK